MVYQVFEHSKSVHGRYSETLRGGEHPGCVVLHPECIYKQDVCPCPHCGAGAAACSLACLSHPPSICWAPSTSFAGEKDLFCNFL